MRSRIRISGKTGCAYDSLAETNVKIPRLKGLIHRANLSANSLGSWQRWKDTITAGQLTWCATIFGSKTLARGGESTTIHCLDFCVVWRGGGQWGS